VNAPALLEETWVLTDGRAGTLSQTRGLAEAVGLPIEVKTVHPRAPWTWLWVTLWPAPFAALGPDSARLAAPWPRIAIGCGWRAIPYMLAIKRQSAGRTFTVQLQHPRVSVKHFDLVVPPEHDRLQGPNVVPIVGSPNGVTRAKLNSAAAQWMSQFDALPKPRIAVLIGGASKSHRFDDADAMRLGAQLKELAAQGFGLMATTSRRTGESQTRIIRDALAQSDAYVSDGTGENPLLGMLALADAVLVTADSTNMVVEATATGKPVYIVDIPGGGPKFDHLHADLKKRGIARAFTGKIEQWTYEPLNETERVAQLIRHKIGLPSR
jgi:uncharacterized protein